MAGVRSTHEADVVGSAAPPLSLRSIKKPWLLNKFSGYTDKCVLGCSIFKIVDGVVLITLLVVLKYTGGFAIAVGIGEILGGILGITSHCARNKRNAYVVLVFVCGVVNRLSRLLCIALAIKLIYLISRLEGETWRIAILGLWLLYLVIITVLDIIVVYQAVQYGRTIKRMALEAERARFKQETFTDIVIYLSIKKSWSVQQGRLVHINEDDDQNLLDAECEENLTAPEA